MRPARLFRSLLLVWILAASLPAQDYTDIDNLFMPEVGSEGWDADVNNNFARIDRHMPVTIATCPSGAAVGDVVYFSAADTVALADADAAATSRAEGIIYEKPTSTTARVLMTGCVDGVLDSAGAALTAGSIYYLSGTAGKIQLSATGFYLPVGASETTGRLCFRPNFGGAMAFSSQVNLFAASNAILDFEVRRWIGHGVTEQAVSLGAGVTTFAATQSYVTIAADGAGNTIGTITCTNCQEGDILRVVKTDGDALTITDTASPGADQLALAGNCVLTTINSTLTVIRTSGGYWASLGCVVN